MTTPPPTVSRTLSDQHRQVGARQFNAGAPPQVQGGYSPWVAPVTQQHQMAIPRTQTPMQSAYGRQVSAPQASGSSAVQRVPPLQFNNNSPQRFENSQFQRVATEPSYVAAAPRYVAAGPSVVSQVPQQVPVSSQRKIAMQPSFERASAPLRMGPGSSRDTSAASDGPTLSREPTPAAAQKEKEQRTSDELLATVKAVTLEEHPTPVFTGTDFSKKATGGASRSRPVARSAIARAVAAVLLLAAATLLLPLLQRKGLPCQWMDFGRRTPTVDGGQNLATRSPSANKPL